MKKNYIGVALLFLSVFLAGCAGDERVINTVPDAWRLLCASYTTHTSLVFQKYPDNSTISPDVFKQANNRELPDRITSIVEFRDALYLLAPSAKKIYSIDSKTFILRDSIDFAPVNRTPSAICFANATTAYVAHADDSVVSVVDILSYKIAREVRVGLKPVGIAAVGNQVFVANQASNTVTQIDTRTNLVVAQHNVPAAPTFVQPSTDGRSAVIICLGNGKINNSAVKSSAYSIFIDAPTAVITQQIELHDAYYPADSAAMPRGMAITKADWAFIPTDMGLFQIDMLNKTKPMIIDEIAYDMAVFNYRRFELLLVKDGNVVVADQNTGKKKEQYTLPVSVNSILGM